MNEGSGFSARIPWLSHKTRIGDLEDILESLPQAALLIQPETWLIRYANSKTFDLTNFTSGELIGVDARSLFADWFEPINVNRSGRAFNKNTGAAGLKHLIRRDRSQILTRLNVSSIKNLADLDLLYITEAEPTNPEPERGSGTPFWKSLNELLEAGNVTEMKDALEKAMKSAAELSRAETVIIYRLMEAAPEIRMLTGTGELSLLPELLNANDLTTLNEARLWETGKQPSCSLYRAARANRVRFLATAPIGDKSAIVGLVLLAGKQNTPSGDAVEIARSLAAVTASIFHSHIQRMNLQSELELRRQQTARYLTIAERVQEGIMQLSADLYIREINPRLEQMLGYSNREVVGQEAEKILVGNDLLPKALAQAQAGESVLTLGELRLFRRNGELFQAMVKVFPMLNEKSVEGILVFIQDQSEKEQIRLQTEDLENRASLGMLMSVFAHEARNPINNISIALQAMGSNLPEDDPRQDQIGRMLQDCDRLAELIKSVLGYSKPMEYTMEPLDLGPLVKRLVEWQRAKLNHAMIQCELQLDEDCAQISGNSRALEQVFNNLVTNAIQAMEGMTGAVTVKVSQIRSEEGLPYVEVSVADNGPGIPKEIQEKIFQPFITTKRNGNGLGLSIAKRIVTAHKGKIRLTSFPGGTVFRVLLPILEDYN